MGCGNSQAVHISEIKQQKKKQDDPIQIIKTDMNQNGFEKNEVNKKEITSNFLNEQIGDIKQKDSISALNKAEKQLDEARVKLPEAGHDYALKESNNTLIADHELKKNYLPEKILAHQINNSFSGGNSKILKRKKILLQKSKKMILKNQESNTTT